MSKKLTNEEVKKIVETIGYDTERLRYLGYGFVGEQRKIQWEIISTGEVVGQRFDHFRKGSVPTKTKREYEIEVANILKERGTDDQYSFELEMGKFVTIHLTRLSDGQGGSTQIGHFRSGRLPKQFVRNCWDLDSFSKHYSEVQPDVSKYIEIVEYFPGIVNSHTTRQTKVKLREISSGKEAISEAWHVLQGQIPQSFDLCVHPQNDIPSRLYLCMVRGYSGKPGIFLTVGIIRENRTTKQRYGKNLVSELHLSKPRLNARKAEKMMLNQIIEALGPPHAGNEAWRHEKDFVAFKVMKKAYKDFSQKEVQNYKAPNHC